MTSRRTILIGGTSHVGKTTLAEVVSQKFGWQNLSTDSLARHPGRPWGLDVPQHVQRYYSPDNEIDYLGDVLAHYRNNVWPIAEAIVKSRESNLYDDCLVLEGSAILPVEVQGSAFSETSPVWLVAESSLIAQRIRSNSDYEACSPENQVMIDRFIERSLAYNDWLIGALKQTSFRSIQVSESLDPNALADDLIAELAL